MVRRGAKQGAWSMDALGLIGACSSRQARDTTAAGQPLQLQRLCTLASILTCSTSCRASGRRRARTGWCRTGVHTSRRNAATRETQSAEKPACSAPATVHSMAAQLSAGGGVGLVPVDAAAWGQGQRWRPSGRCGSPAAAQRRHERRRQLQLRAWPKPGGAAAHCSSYGQRSDLQAARLASQQAGRRAVGARAACLPACTCLASDDIWCCAMGARWAAFERPSRRIWVATSSLPARPRPIGRCGLLLVCIGSPLDHRRCLQLQPRSPCAATAINHAGRGRQPRRAVQGARARIQ